MELLLFAAIGAAKGACFGTNQIEISQDVIFPVIERRSFLGVWLEFFFKDHLEKQGSFFEETSSQALRITLVTSRFPRPTCF